MLQNQRQRQASLRSFRFISTHQLQSKKYNDHPISQKKQQLLQKQQHQHSAVIPNKLLPTISQQREAKKIHAKQLTTLIHKFNHLNENQSMKYSQQLIKCTIGIIKAFSNIQNNFQQLFAHLYLVIRRFCFIISDIEILNKYNLKDGISFRKGCFMMDNYSDNIVKEKQKQFVELKNNYQNMKIQYYNSQNQWKEQKKILQDQVQKYKKLANVQYVKGLQKKVLLLKEQISERQQQYTKLARQNQQAYQQIDHLKNLIELLRTDISQLNQDVYNLNVDKQNFQRYVAQLRDRFDDLLGKMISIKQTIANVQQENQKLISQRTKLIQRGAVGFDNLTPRPKYQKLINKKLKDYGQLNTTQTIMQKMFKISQKVLQKDHILNQILIMKKIHKLQQAEKIRNQATDQIILAKKQLNNIF